MPKGMKCPACGKTRIWSKGVTPTRTGQHPRFICFACGKTFYATAGKPAKAPRAPRKKPAKKAEKKK